MIIDPITIIVSVVFGILGGLVGRSFYTFLETKFNAREIQASKEYDRAVIKAKRQYRLSINLARSVMNDSLSGAPGDVTRIQAEKEYQDAQIHTRNVFQKAEQAAFKSYEEMILKK